MHKDKQILLQQKYNVQIRSHIQLIYVFLRYKSVAPVLDVVGRKEQATYSDNV